MQAFLSIYSLIDWILRGAAMAAQTVAVGGATYFLLTLAPSNASGGGRAALDRFCMRVMFWSATASCVAQLMAAAALTAFLIGSAGADLKTAMSADAITFHVVSACAAFALACVARWPRLWTPWTLVLPSSILIVAHTGLTHAASRTEVSAAMLVAEMLHLLALAAWIGGVPYFVASLRMLGDRESYRFVARRFSAVSFVSVFVVVATGVFMAVPFAGSLGGLYQTNYGLLISTKSVLLIILLCLGAMNFLAIRKLQRDSALTLRSAPIIAETEVGVGLIAIFCAAALAASPLASETSASRPDTADIAKRFELAWPRLESPAFAQPSAVDSPAIEIPVAPRPSTSQPERSAFDIAWSEAHHHYAALIVVAAGLVALFSQSRRIGRFTRNWPALFLVLAGYLFVVADEDAWPLGKIGFFESLATPRIAQHKFMIALIAAFAIYEWRVQLQRFKSQWPSYVFPLTLAAAAAFLLTHYGHTDSKEEVLIEISHTPVALIGVIAAIARWLEIRLPASSLSRVAGIVWPIAFMAGGAFLLLYRETF